MAGKVGEKRGEMGRRSVGTECAKKQFKTRKYVCTYMYVYCASRSWGVREKVHWVSVQRGSRVTCGYRIY